MERVRFFSLAGCLCLLLAVVSGCREENLYTMFARTGCGLAEVPPDVPETAESVQLQNNEISELKAGEFSELGECVSLDLSGNQISEVEERAFKGLDNLQELNIKNNKLTFLYGKLMWIGLRNLEELDLSHNQIFDIEPQSFLYLNNLKVLKLQGNMLTELYSDMWEGVPELTTLYLSDNKIYMVWGAGFSNLPLLERLRLSDNELTTLEEHVFSSVDIPGVGHPTNLVLTINNNPLHCDSVICWLKEAESEGWISYNELYDQPPECENYNQGWNYVDLNCTWLTEVNIV